MLFARKPAGQKRRDLRKALRSGKLLRFPGAFSPYVSLLIERLQFEGVYISGAALSNDLGFPDIGLTTQTEVVQRGQAIARVTELPALIDSDTGFGEAVNVARTIQELEEAGLCGCHLEDQVNPKRCGHLDNKRLIESREMVRKIQSAVAAKRDANLLLIARTDARTVEGLDKAIERAKAYVDAGAEMIFPEALQTETEFERFRKVLPVPLLANMTEFGKSPLLTCERLQNLGYNVVIYPVTAFRLAMKAVEEGLAAVQKEGTQERLLAKMQDRKRLYEVLRYQDYSQFDQRLFNFEV